MSIVELIKSYLSYNEIMNGRILDSIMKINAEQYEVDANYSRGSIRDQELYLVAAESRWLRGIQGYPDARTYNPTTEDYPTPEAAYQLWEEHRIEFRAYIDSLDETELQRVPKGMPGPVWQALLQVANHGTDHRAQILRLLNDIGEDTYEQDIIYFLGQS